MKNWQRIQSLLGLLSILMISSSLYAQEISYYITVPSGVRGVAQQLPSSIDSTHYYSFKEIRELPEPVEGWDKFYTNMDTLEYPDEAKKGKIQSSMLVAYMINESGAVDSVYVHSVDEYGKWEVCKSCENLIVDFLKNTNWVPGRVHETPVKAVDYLEVEFQIFDPNNKSDKNTSPFGY